MRRSRWRAVALIAVTAWTLTGCGSSGGASSPAAPGVSSPSASGPFAFTVSPIALDAISSIPALGNLSPPGHTLPSDHLNVGQRPLLVSVVAPADGVVQFTLGGGASGQLGVRNGSFLYVLSNLSVNAGLQSGVTVKAGQQLGMTSGLDFGLLNYSRQLFFANPARYVDNELYCDSPIAYFVEPLRSQLYALVPRVGSDRDGRIDYDVAGRLAGNWFLDGLAPSLSQFPAAWSQHLAFTYDNYDPAQVRISIGGVVASPGVFTIPASAPLPRDVSVASGRVAYPLLFAGPPGGLALQPPGFPQQTMLVQMIDDVTIRVEVFPRTVDAATPFDGNAFVYRR